VVVAGGGPAGSATATLLARAGARVMLIERATYPRPKPCAEYLSPGVGGLLDRLGVLAEVERRAIRLTGMRIVSPAGRSFVGRFTPDAGFAPFRPWGFALPRAELDAMLANGAVRAGATLHEHATAESFTVTPAGVSVTIRGRRSRHSVRAGLLIGADGLHSRIAEQLGLARRQGARRVALVAHFEGVADMRDVGEMHVGRRGYVGLATVADGITNVAAVIPVADLPPGVGAAERLVTFLRQLPAVHARMTGSRMLGPTLAAGPFGRRTLRATADGVALVGDAADFYDPFTGEGIYSALRGAELLVPHVLRALDAGACSARDLAAYDRARRLAFGGKWLLERLIGAVVSRPAWLDHVAVRLARRQATADLLVGAAGDFVPAGRVLRPSVAFRLVA